MASRHVSGDNVVKAYLLGTLSESLAAAVERQYFLDPELLKRVQGAETALIADYLAGMLSRVDRELFERRYLGTPDLARKVEEARLAASHHRPKGRTREFRWLAPAGVLASILIGVGVWYHAPPAGSTVARTSAKPLIAIPAVVLRLSPGVNKGAPARNAVVNRPAAGSDLQLELGLPGDRAIAECTVRLEKIESGGARTALWTSPVVRSVPENGDTQVVVSVPGSLAEPGDYVARVAAGGTTIETYTFRVLRSF